MPNNNWTKQDVINLNRFNRDGYSIKFDGHEIVLFLGRGEDGLDGWVNDQEDWESIEGYPTFTYVDGRGDVYNLDDYPKTNFTVEKVNKVDWNEQER